MLKYKNIFSIFLYVGANILPNIFGWSGATGNGGKHYIHIYTYINFFPSFFQFISFRFCCMI